MKRIAGLLAKEFILMLAVVFLVAGVVACACGKPTPDTTTNATYNLTHSAADAEYILSWDLIVSQCPDIGAYDKIEAFVHRGESVQITTGETYMLDEDSPAAWVSTRFVRTEWEGGRFLSFAVNVVFSETAEGLDESVDELLQTPGFWESVQEEGDFVTAVHETETPMQAIQLLLAGKHFFVLIQEFASSEESLFFDKDALIELRSIAKNKISLLEITPLPAEIPEREP